MANISIPRRQTSGRLFREQLFREQSFREQMSRRQFLQRAMLSSAVLCFPNFAAATSDQALRWQKLQDNVFLVRGPDFNACVFSGNDGVCLIDGGTEAQSKQLLKLIRANCQQGLPQVLFNTHWHRQQTGCNSMLGRHGATIIAHENTKLWLTTEVISTWENLTYSPLPKQALPNRTFFYDTQQLQFNGEAIEYGYLPQAHTDGDIYVRFAERNIVIAGGVVAYDHFPIVDYVSGGWLGGMIDALKAIIAMTDEETVIVPALGEPCKRTDVQRQLQLCENLIGKIATNYYRGLTYQDFLDTKPIDDSYLNRSSPDVFLRTAYEGVWWHIREARRWVKRS